MKLLKKNIDYLRSKKNLSQELDIAGHYISTGLVIPEIVYLKMLSMEAKVSMDWLVRKDLSLQSPQSISANYKRIQKKLREK